MSSKSGNAPSYRLSVTEFAKEAKFFMVNRVLFIFLVILSSCTRAEYDKNFKHSYLETDLPRKYRFDGVNPSGDGFKVEIVRETRGVQASPGDRLIARYDVKLMDGTKVDSSADSELWEFEVGTGKILAGLDLGLDQIRAGEKRKITLPPSRAQGPAKSEWLQKYSDQTLIYEIEVMGVFKSNG